MQTPRILFSILLAALPFATGAATPAGDKVTTLQWRMSLATDGRITALVPKGEGVEALRPRLEQAIRQWEFVPGRVNGKAAATETLLTVQLTLTPNADASAFTVRIKDARTGGGIGKTEPVRFSALAMKKLMGRDTSMQRQVVFNVSYDASGTATGLEVAAGSPVTEGPLMDSVEKALRKFSYEPELVGGHAVAGKVVIPTCLVIWQGSPSDRKSAPACSWTPPGSDAVLDNGQALALDSSVQLKTAVVGSLL